MAWEDELNKAYSDYTNREKFSYDPTTDAGYNHYKQAYLQMGKLASKDAIGQASTLSGGYGNSWATTVGAQQYMNYAGQAAQAIPTFQNMALQQYQMEGDQLVNRYNMASAGRDFDYKKERDAVADSQWREQFDYQKSRDSVADSQWQQSFDYQKSRDAVSDSQWQKQFDTAYQQWRAQFDYQKSRDAVSDSQWNQSFAYNKSRDSVADQQWATQLAYNQARDAVSDNQWQQTFDYQKSRDSVSDSQWAKELQYKYAALNKSSSGSNSGDNGNDGQTADYQEWKEAYVQGVKKNGMQDAKAMLDDAVRNRWITDRERNSIIEYYDRQYSSSGYYKNQSYYK